MVPIPGSRKIERMKENAGSTAIRLTAEEVAELDSALDRIPMSAVFGGTR
ncbi:MAG: aldo/keto reductase [Spirochaetaceae bacterium]|nr:aldo/keto reductase [Spirochaetaceae bacterium]